MASWHEKDCRRPDVELMDNTPTCLSCGSLFFQNDDEAQEQLGKQTAKVDGASPVLNLDWPSSITFSSPDDVTEPDLKRILRNLDRYAEVAYLDTPWEKTPSEYEAFMEQHAARRMEVEHSAAAGTLPDGAEPLMGDAPRDDYGMHTSTEKLDLDAPLAKSETATNIQNGVYKSLMGTDEIRLLHLDPYETVSQPLHGFLRPTRLSQRPDYVALSYTWADTQGDRTLCEKIFLGNAWTPFAITSNCAAALRRLRLRGGTRVVWIDAICIDQTNIGERSHQVSMMRDIYSRAESVAIYLGGDTGQHVDTPAGRLMQRLSDERFRAGKAITDNWGGGFDYHGICDLFGQPYWSRIWVIQEVLLARKGEIILGDASISLHEFTENFMKQLPGSIESLLPLWIYSLGGSRFGDVDAFSNLLNKTSACQASDERDMIFALFGLVQGASLEGLVADYSKTKTEIGTGLAAYFLIRHGQSAILKTAAFAATSAAAAAKMGIRAFKYQTFKGRVPRYTVADGSTQGYQARETDKYPRHQVLASWIPFGKSLDPHVAELFQDKKPPTFDKWCQIFATEDKKQGCNEYYHLTQIQPRACEPLQTSLNTYKVFRNHGTLLIRASPVVHISYTGSAMLHGAFTSTTKDIFGGNMSILTAVGTSMRWEICVHTHAWTARDDDWIIEAPGCDTFLHLKPSGRVPGTYYIASSSSVLLVRNYHRPEISHSNGQYGPVSKDTLSPAGNATGDYRLWMPLISCELQHLVFLRQWESITRSDSLVAPRQSGPGDSPVELSPEVLEKYGQWLELIPTPNSGDGLQYDDFDSSVRTVSLYLERWDDPHLWSRINEIVVEVPWKAKLQELADVKAGVWQYLATRNRSVAGKPWDAIRWEYRLQGLFDDIIDRLPGIPLHATEGVQSLGSFMSKDTCVSLLNSVKHIPDSWSLNKIRAKEAKIFKDWTGVESSWEFMERSKADCHALRGKFDQLRALKRLCRREHRDFLIC